MERLERLSGRLDTITIKIGQMAAWCSVPIIIIVMLDVITRRFFTLGSVTLQELEWHFHAILFLFCAGWAYLTDTHVRVDVFRARMSPRKQAWIEFLGGIVFLVPFCITMMWLGSRFVADSYLLHEVSDAPGGLPYRFLIKAAMPVGFGLLLLQGVSQVIKNYIVLAKGQDSGAT
jgi:TRAP-type mannitol/chloroaromatic compound transport system permease small subunit